MRRRDLVVVAVAVVAVAAGALVMKFRAVDGGGGGGRGLRVVVTVAPLVELARSVAPEGSEVRALMPPGQSEHGYEFTPGDLAALAEADVVVYVGLGLEPQVEEFVAMHPTRSRQDVCFARAVGLGDVQGVDGHDDEDDGEGHAHEEDHGVDPHLWLDPAMVKQLVPVLSGAMGAAARARGIDSPEASSKLVAAEEALEARVDALDAEFRAKLSAFKGSAIVTHHRAWGRLASRYGLEVAATLRPVESAEPTPGQVAEVMRALEEHKAGAVFVEPQFDSTSVRRIAETAGVKVERLDPLGDGDWFATMRSNLESLVRGLSK